jgi:hypothetical protein
MRGKLRRAGWARLARLASAALLLTGGLAVGGAAQAISIDYTLPATALPSQDPPYPVVATLMLVQTADGVQFTLDPNEASPGFGANSFVERVDIAYAGDPLDASDFLHVSGTEGDFSFEDNPNNFDAGYQADVYHIVVDFPSAPSDRLEPGGSSTWTVLGATLADFAGTFATANNKPSPIYSVISVTGYSLPDHQPTPSNWVAVVPEPGTALLLLVGVGGLAVEGRRRR